MTKKQITLKNPLGSDWTEQYVRLTLDGVAPGTPIPLEINGKPAVFQYTGNVTSSGAEIMVKLGFSMGLVTHQGGACCEQDLQRIEIPLGEGALIGLPGRQLNIPAPVATGSSSQTVVGPFAGFAGWPMASVIRCEEAYEGASLVRTNEGPLFSDYELEYRFAQRRRYTLTFRCYKNDPYIEVSESFSLGMNAGLQWTLNPQKDFTHIISRDSFEGESQPAVEQLGVAHPRDVICRLQMPVLTEYFIPNNRGWFAFFDERHESRGMVGVLGLYGAKWVEPVANMPELLDRGGTVEWHSSLASGKRHWLLYSGPVQTAYQTERFIFHRLHAEFNAMRLDENLDLAGAALFDGSCAKEPGLFEAGDYHAAARERHQTYGCLQALLNEPDSSQPQKGSMHLANHRYLLEPSAEHAREVAGHLTARFEKWVRQFQGYRTGQHDYMKNVIGFSRYLRGMLLGYEMLRRDEALTEAEVRQLNDYFVFAARRILDEGRWPHSRTWKHPDHPESTRDFYAYGGEHKPDRLVWTNSLPNFQSDPMCALAHLAAIFKDHPDAPVWQRTALDELDRQLDAYCGKSGAWEESINYALYTLSYFVVTFKVVKARCGIDYFNDERVRRFVGWLCRFFGPFDKRFDGYTWPAIGNSVLPQKQAEYLLCYASELPAADPLRAACLAVWQKLAGQVRLHEHYPVIMGAMAPLEILNLRSQILNRESECMDEVGVAMRDRHTRPDESYLFQKIGFAKDHYEADETSFNWYAKGTPFCMDYGTYTSDIAVGGAHNIVEIPDEDSLRRGYLADHVFTPVLDYTRAEVPVTLKLLWGKVRSFAEVENKDGKIDRTKTPYFYIGDKNPVGPKVWKVRQLLYVKPDYTVLLDRVFGEVPHRFNLHFTGDQIRREGALVMGCGRFDLDLLVHVQHPARFDLELGECIPEPDRFGRSDDNPHRQCYFRLYNRQDGLYRTVLFARERGRDVQMTSVGNSGVKVVTSEYADYVFLNDEVVNERVEGIRFVGRAGWIRKDRAGRVEAVMVDGDLLEGHGVRIEGRGPWRYDATQATPVQVLRGPPRDVHLTISCL